MATIELRQVEKKFGDVYAVKPMDLTIHDGEFVVLLGPSGCGKTTTLRMLCGLEAVTGGQILLNGRDVTWAHPSDRNIAYVFQFFALYPHMTALQNIAFPLQAQGMPRAEIKVRVDEVVKLLRIKHLLRLRPGTLSGGDQQRVAVARALVRRPAAFLMDEPLGALDADFRAEMRAELKRLHIEQHATTVYVTHDQLEAMAMGDRIVVMSEAVVQQVGSPADVYHRPANLFVARFIGSPGMSLVPGHLTGDAVRLASGGTYTLSREWAAALQRDLGGTGDVIMGFRPESASVSGEGALAGQTYASDRRGAYNVLHVSLDGEMARIRADRSHSYAPGETVRFDVDPEMVRFFNPQTEVALTRRVQE